MQIFGLELLLWCTLLSCPSVTDSYLVSDCLLRSNGGFLVEASQNPLCCCGVRL